jgi:hypothetical protein
MEPGVDQRAAGFVAHAALDPSGGAAGVRPAGGAGLVDGVVRWRIVLEAQGLHLPLGRATRISLVAQFFNSFLLGSTGGDLIKAYYAARETHHKKTEAVTTVFVDRLVGLWAMLLFAGVMMIPNYAMLRASRDVGVPALFILAMLGGLRWCWGWRFGAVFQKVCRGRGSICAGCPKGECWNAPWIRAGNSESKRASCSKRLPFPCWSMSSGWCKSSCLGQGLDLSIPPMALFVIVPVIFCISALPITPNGLGVRENLFVLMLAVDLVPKTAALSVSLIASAQGLFWSLVGGLFTWGAPEGASERSHPRRRGRKGELIPGAVAAISNAEDMDKLLLIDDEADVQYSFRRIFDQPDIELTTANSGEEGLKLIPRLKPDLVIMDVRMGGISGLETLRRLRQIRRQTDGHHDDGLRHDPDRHRGHEAGRLRLFAQALRRAAPETNRAQRPQSRARHETRSSPTSRCWSRRITTWGSSGGARRCRMFSKSSGNWRAATPPP